MKVRRSSMYISLSTVGTLALMGGLSTQAWGGDARTQLATSQQQPGNEQKEQSGELIKAVREATARDLRA